MSSQQVLYIVATPIGHRDDLSARAIDELRNVDRIYAEDTRHSLPLLRYHGIETRVWALHEHNEQSQIDVIIEHLLAGNSAALISDAGTPLISDPGFRLVRACRKAGIRVSPIPGASAFLAALSVSGLPTDRFEFVGFAPQKQSARKAFFGTLAEREHTVVLYESPHRIVECLSDVASVFGDDRQLCVARELTKKFETTMTGLAVEVIAQVTSDANQRKGEFVLCIAGVDKSDDATSQTLPGLDRTLGVLLEHLPIKAAAKAAADLFPVNKREAYERALVLQGKSQVSKGRAQ